MTKNLQMSFFFCNFVCKLVITAKTAVLRTCATLVVYPYRYDSGGGC